MDRSLIALTAASLAGIGLMAAAGHYTEPPLVPFAHLAEHVGTTVRTDARVLQPQTYPSGYTRFLLSDGNHSIEATCEEELPVSPGDTVRATAIVTQLGAKLQLQLDRADDLTLILPWEEGHIPLARILDAPWEYRDTQLRTSGRFERDASALWLRAPDADARLRLTGAQDEPSSSSIVVVSGAFQFDLRTSSFRLYVDPLESA